METRNTKDIAHLLADEDLASNRTIILDRAREMSDIPGKELLEVLDGSIVAVYLENASTDAWFGWQSAVSHLGGNAIPVIAEASSLRKGESLQDTIRMMAGNSHLVVLGQNEYDVVELIPFSNVPIINVYDRKGLGPEWGMIEELGAERAGLWVRMALLEAVFNRTI